MIRSQLVRALYRGLLGPKNGVREVIEEPYLQYQMGILNSAHLDASRASTLEHAVGNNINPDPAEVQEESVSGCQPIADDEQDADVLRQEVDTDLSFALGTVSLGLHFVLKGDCPKFKICLTWARYDQQTDLGTFPRIFKRRPIFFVSKWLSASDPPSKISADSEESDDMGKRGAMLYILPEKIKGEGRWIVRIFMVNETPYEQRQKEADRIFQPQIRVIADEKTELDALNADRITTRGEGQHEDDELLYFKSPTKARGHMCAAVWRDVDPEIDADGEMGRGLSWPDGEFAPRSIRDEFTLPLVRTEYLPRYAVLQPDISKRTFDAGALSDMWDPDRIEQELGAITTNFACWIDGEGKKVDDVSFPPRFKDAARKNLEECRGTNLRICDGIDFLKSSEKARAAFCFMNAVMNDKRRSEHSGKNLEWREFQMAFILQSLRGVSGDSEVERSIADVLWFPTGGGKTEAYLGIVIFALAYRRLTPSGTYNTDGGVAVISRYTLRLLTIQQFQRALGAIVAADILRVKNWLPHGAKEGDQKLTDPHLLERLRSGRLWGGHRFSIGLWIGGKTTPNDFAHTTVKHGKVLLNCEGFLRPQHDDLRKYSEETGDPAQILSCPMCNAVLCIPKNYDVDKAVKITWIIKSQKTAGELAAIPQKHFEDLMVSVKRGPTFDPITDHPDGRRSYRITMELSAKKRSERLGRETVDSWWRDTVRPALGEEGVDHLLSTAPSMPGYFYLSTEGSPRPHDFAIYCTDKDCKLNQTEWFEILEGDRGYPIPEPFRIAPCRSRSIPISAYTIDEQVYLKCPSIVLATVDKFANLPFEPKCASLFGNVNALHPEYGYGRIGTLVSPIKDRNGKKRQISQDETIKVSGFVPPSLILQDELHLIEGPLGSMVGIYEMAVDVLASHSSKPKYIASSATIKGAASQVGTIFRRGVRRFPPPGIDSSRGYFSSVSQDVQGTSKNPGRLYIGMATTKSTVTLPIRIQSTVMSEIFKILAHPDGYSLSEGEKINLKKSVDPYWTFVTYFTDLQLLSKFTNYYDEEITNNVRNWSGTKSYNSTERTPTAEMPQGMHLFKVRAEHAMNITSVSVYCGRPSDTPADHPADAIKLDTDNKSTGTDNNGKKTKDAGPDGAKEIRVAVYRDGGPTGSLAGESKPQSWKAGENVFDLNGGPLKIAKGESVWVAVANNASVIFQTVRSPCDSSLDYKGPPLDRTDPFPETLECRAPQTENPAMVSINEKSRSLEGSKNVTLSSATSSEELAHSLEELKHQLHVDSLQTSPVFGTGIDIDRLGVMTVMNQPKTNSGYIQATGRVGRTSPGLVISWLRAGRARDLDHYENFIGYHMTLHRFVEPVTASPFSSKALRLCLGPILVSLLRNAEVVLGKKVNSEWALRKTGPLLMSQLAGSPEIASIKNALTQISQSEFVPEYRRMGRADFEDRFDEARSAWRKVAAEMTKSGDELHYEERSPSSLPKLDVVLGNPKHTEQKRILCYENAPNSLRQTEMTAAFHSGGEVVAIRPSQFITRYGPGSLIPRKSDTWVVPDVKKLIRSLERIQNFDSPDTQGQTGLKKYAVNDNQMRRILHRLNPKVEWENLGIFQLPSNLSLALSDLDKLYQCDSVSEWGICHNVAHHTKILGKIVQDGNKRVVFCPECEKVSGNPKSGKFYSVRFLVACKKGHLGDLNWRLEVHQGKKCNGNVFEWRVSGSSDNVEIMCKKCGKSTNLIELTARSNNGQIQCTGEFPESGKTESCERINNRSHAKIVSKGLMSLKLPIIMTTLNIQSYKGTLPEYYEPIALSLDAWIVDNNDWTKESLVSYMTKQKGRRKKGFTNKLIEITENATDNEIQDAIDWVEKITTVDGQKEESMTELESLEAEIFSLENQTRDNGTGAQIGTDTSPPDNRFPIKFDAGGLHFEAMPFDNIRVTQVQTGYTREITSPADSSQGGNWESSADMTRVGEPVWFSSRYEDSSKKVWYVANQLVGEGIFIHLDPISHPRADDMFAGSHKSYADWASIHERVRKRNEALIKAKEGQEGEEQTIDALNMAIMRTHPLFVWWHSFAHELINQLAIDSGFAGTSLGERVYCVERRGDGRYAAGLLVYAVSPGADGTLGGLTSLVDKDVLPKIVRKTLLKTHTCSIDPLCYNTVVHQRKLHGAACHVCLMNSETSCAYQNRFLDRKIVMEAITPDAAGNC